MSLVSGTLGLVKDMVMRKSNEPKVQCPHHTRILLHVHGFELQIRAQSSLIMQLVADENVLEPNL